MIYSIQHIAQIIQSTIIPNSNNRIEYLLTDSRKISFPQTSLFFALSGQRRDGHLFIEEAYHQGVRFFVVLSNYDETKFIDATFLIVTNVLQALQKLASYHRSQFSIPVIGITGSNGKTIVKEWLYQLLQTDYQIVRSPRSYNSQIGVPLSVWQLQEQHTLGIFEAGISTVNEMSALAQIIQPTMGILTNIGEAHKDGFLNDEQKLREKLQLFKTCSTLIYSIDHTIDILDIEAKKRELFQQPITLIGWSRENKNASFYISNERQQQEGTSITFTYQSQTHQCIIPFTDAASVNNAITCIATLFILQIPFVQISNQLRILQPVEMRLQLKKGVHNSHIINDSYSNDISSLNIALDYLQQQSGGEKSTVILSDILQSGLPENELYQQVIQALQQRKIQHFIGIGEAISKQLQAFQRVFKTAKCYPTTEAFLQQYLANHIQQFSNQYILLKGARKFAFEQIAQALEQKVHQTILEVNLSAMAHNLKQYQQYLLPTTKLMAMVKAFSYGSGSVEVARLLQFHKIDYLAVAYADEGIELRKAGIHLPIMVMNIDEAGFAAMIEFSLEPEMYSFNIFNAFHQYLLQQGITQFPIHLKLNTGMNRLGFELHEIQSVINHIATHNTMMVKSLFSHLVASENPEHDAFTQQQAAWFNQAIEMATKTLQYPFLQHLANSSGIFRHPHLQYNMVRLGIGLYGVDSANGKTIQLETVASLKTTIAQIRMVEAGQTIGYNRKGLVNRKSKIATIRIGYADGLNRKLSNGVGSVYVHGQLAPIIGNICMDMTMIDVTDIPQVQEGDMVEIFGKNIAIETVAQQIQTIAYEVMTSVSQRVKRVYIQE